MSELAEQIAREHRGYVDREGFIRCLARGCDWTMPTGPNAFSIHISTVTVAAQREQIVSELRGEGVPGNAGEFISVNEAIRIVEDTDE